MAIGVGHVVEGKFSTSTSRMAVGVVKKRGECYAEGDRRRSLDAVTAPSWPKFGGPYAQAYAGGQRSAEGSHRHNVSYAEGIATPTTLLAG
jgi:hypothetical protein